MNSIMTIDHVSYRYPQAAQPALHDVSVTLARGWTGLVGDNGCGKTTLAMVAAGLLAPDEGTVSPRLFSAYCPQDSSLEPPTLADFASDWGQDAVRLRRLLHIDDAWPWRFRDLSGGEQKRVQIASCLWARPDLLVMDEPTNDLDAESRDAVRRALASFDGIGLLVSHDRDLLDRLASRCLVFEGGHPTMRSGGYTEAVAQVREEAAAARLKRKHAQRDVARIQREAARRAEEAQRSARRLSCRTVDRHDSSTREKIGRARVSGKDGRAGRSASVMEHRLASAQAALSDAVAPKRYGYRFEAVGEAARIRSLCHLEATELRRGDFTLAIPELWVSPTDHIGVVGRNGAGKSTLIGHLVEHVAENVRVAFVPQDVGPGQRDAVLGRLSASSSEDAGRVLSHVARLNSDPVRITDGVDLSPGEMRKLVLAEQLLGKPNMLVLDEPTNHMDVGSIEALQGLLRSFAGAVVVVSHDAPLLEGSCDLWWELREVAPGSFRLHVA